MLNLKYNYSKLQRNTKSNGTRTYLTPFGDSVFSVTTILKETQSEETRQALQDWIERVGTEEAEKIKNYAANIGDMMHKRLEQYINKEEISEKQYSFSENIANKMANKIWNEGLKNVTEFYGCEVPVYYNDLYAGTTDCVGLWKNKLAIIDFKQSNNIKKEEWINDYKLQLTAYALAHNSLFDTNINTGVIMMCTQQNLTYQEFVVTEKEFENVSIEWAKRVEQFYEENK